MFYSKKLKKNAKKTHISEGIENEIKCT